ncbi:MAG: hypothetical protein ACK40O_14095, partial [Allosphingosinicella sp.]
MLPPLPPVEDDEPPVALPPVFRAVPGLARGLAAVPPLFARPALALLGLARDAPVPPLAALVALFAFRLVAPGR